MTISNVYSDQVTAAPVVRSQHEPVMFEPRKRQPYVADLEIGTIAAYNDNLCVPKIRKGLDRISQSFSKRRPLLTVNGERRFSDRSKPGRGEDMHFKSEVGPRQEAVALKELLESARPSSSCAIKRGSVGKNKNGMSVGSHRRY